MYTVTPRMNAFLKQSPTETAGLFSLKPIGPNWNDSFFVVCTLWGFGTQPPARLELESHKVYGPHNPHFTTHAQLEQPLLERLRGGWEAS